jgi:hypothetical protein
MRTALRCSVLAPPEIEPAPELQGLAEVVEVEQLAQQRFTAPSGITPFQLPEAYPAGDAPAPSRQRE